MMVTKIVVRHSLQPFPRPDTHKKNSPCHWLGVCSRCVTNMAQQFLRDSGLSTSKKKLGHNHNDAFFMLPQGCSIRHGHTILSRNLTHPTQYNNTRETLTLAANEFVGRPRLAPHHDWSGLALPQPRPPRQMSLHRSSRPIRGSSKEVRPRLVRVIATWKLPWPDRFSWILTTHSRTLFA